MCENETIVYLDFNNRLTKEVFENGKEAFIRMANLHKKHPLVQINDTVFQGTYDYAMGTNLFFEPVLDAPVYNDPFIKRGPVQYENSFTAIKTIAFKAMKVPPRKVELSKDVSKIEFNLDWDYPTLLQKISEGSIKLQDILKKENSCEENREELQVETMEIDNELVQNTEQSEENNENDVKDETILDEIIPTEILDDYQKLRKLAFRPVKRRAILDKVENCDSVYKDKYEYNNLEKQVLQPCASFMTEPVTDINEETLVNCVDIDRCAFYGIIEKSSNKPRILTKEEKNKVLTLDNFDNISLAARYYVLKTHIKDLENYLSTSSNNKLNIPDKYGRIPLETLEIYKKLTEALRRRIEEIKYSLEENTVP